MLRPLVLLSALLLGVALSASPPANACLHAHSRWAPSDPQSESYTLSQKGQHALIVHHDGREELIMAFAIEASAPLSTLAWIVPVPAAPDHYDTTSTELFSAIAKWTALKRVVKWLPLRQRRAKSKGGGGGGGASGRSNQSALRVLGSAQAGPYDIQPLQATGEAGVLALQGWMKTHGFVPLKREQLIYYVERHWTFLAIRLQAATDEKSISDKGLLPPLRLSFPSERAVYPLKLSTHQGTFPVRVDIVTQEALPGIAFDGAKARGFEVAGAKGVRYRRAKNTNPCPKSLRRPGLGYQDKPKCSLRSRVHAFKVADSPAPLQAELARIGLSGKLYIRSMYSRDFGRKGMNPSGWSEDLSVPALAEGERLEGVPAKAPAPEANAKATARAVASVTPAPTPTTVDAAAEEQSAAPEEAPPAQRDLSAIKDESAGCALHADSGRHPLWLSCCILWLALVSWRRSLRERLSW